MINASSGNSMNNRYIVRSQEHPYAPFFVHDTLLEKNSSSHHTYESASTRAYILNRFGNGRDRLVA